MNLKLFNFETVLSLNNLISVIEIEDIHLLRKTIETIQSQKANHNVEEKIYIYDEQYNEMNYRKLELIINYIDLFSSLKITNEIIKVIDNQLNESQEELIYSLNLSLNEFATQILYNLDIDINYKDTFQLKDLIQILKVSVNDNYSILDNLFTLVDFYSLSNTENLLFFINLKSYLEIDELIELYEHVLAKDIKVVLLEGRASSKILKYEQKLCIDSTFDDHYQIYNAKI